MREVTGFTITVASPYEEVMNTIYFYGTVEYCILLGRYKKFSSRAIR